MAHTRFTGTKAMFLIIILLATWGNNAQMAAAEIFYPSTNYRLKEPPTYCTVIEGIDESPSKIAEFVNVSKDAVSSWTNNLQAAEDGIKEIWSMNHKSVSNIQAGCDILVYYKSHQSMSEQPASHDIIAGTFTATSTAPALIDIYYLQPFICDDGVLCYFDDRYRDTVSLYGTMLHEVGHSLGAHHYVSDEIEENEKWRNGDELPPSVMIPSLPANVEDLTIKNLDVQKIRSIYGERGFYSYSDRPLPIFHPFVTIDISSEKVVVNNAHPNTVIISGQINKAVLLDGHPIIVSVLKPDQTIDVLKITHTRNGYFEVLTAYDSESPLGLYTVSASYIGVVDNEMDVYFEVINTDAKKNPLTSSSDVVGIIDMQKTAVNSLKQQAENLKKAMTKIPQSSILKKDSNFIHSFSNSVELKIESAYLQIAKAEDRLNARDYEAVFAALRDLDSSVNSASNTLDRLSKIVKSYSVAEPVDDLEGAKNAIKRVSAGLEDGSEFASAVSALTDTVTSFDEIPEWVVMVSKWWSIGLISDAEYVNMLKYIAQNGILS